MKDKEIYDDQNYHTYKTSFWSAIGSGFTIIIPFGFSCYLLITETGSFGEKSFVFVFVLIFGGLLAYIFNRYLVRSKQILQLSPDNDIFYFSDGSSTQQYNKEDIVKITIYQPGGGAGKSLHYFYVYELLFKDGSVLKFSNMLISEKKVLDNFLRDLVRYDPKSPFWKL
jgi:hypothetical protein